jgi:hypothetical protein
MSNVQAFEILDTNDTEAIQRITVDAYSLVRQILRDSYGAPPKELTKQRLGTDPNCHEGSQAVTLAALGLGYLASREFSGNGHTFTSFGSLTELPAEDDFIACMTWGQFNQPMFRRVIRQNAADAVYFGKRSGIRELIGLNGYRHFISKSIVWRSTTYTPDRTHKGRRLWLKTTPNELASLEFPIGEVERNAYPEDLWDEMDLKPHPPVPWGGQL